MPMSEDGLPSRDEFLVTKEYRRFAEFCDACRRDRYIGVCYGAPGVGKTLSARHYARWDLVEPLLTGFREVLDLPIPAEVAACFAAVYTPTVTTTPHRMAHGLAGLSLGFTYPQLYSRIGFVHHYRALSEDELRFILAHTWQEIGLTFAADDYTDGEALAAIARITGGNFRLVQRLFAQIARVLEINRLRTVTKEVIEAARESLVIGLLS